ncbi:hypothetical protein [Agrobacterium sp. M50-1]|uniref:hypothetical protein n=1 Tax=Agrobacterium sp. M50-1 TaxID=3132821 RepID=UPI003CE4A018
MNMIEKVAMAILKRRYYDPEPQMYGNDPEAFFYQLDPDHILDAHDEAKAAIEAMREPTPEMLEAATGWFDHVAADETYPMARGVMRAAVGAALEDHN